MNLKAVFVIFSLLLLNLGTIPSIYAAPEDEATFSWAETTFSTSLSTVWDGEVVSQSFNGSYSDVDVFTDYYINHSDNTFIEEKRVVDYSANYSYYYNYSVVGTFDLDIDITVYKVEVDYGSSAKLIWMALKKGFYEVDRYLDTYGFCYGYNETRSQIIDKEIKKYDRDSLELLSTWNETENVNDTIEYSFDSPVELVDDHQILNQTYTKPFFLTFQVYKTEKGGRVAWASIFSEFLVFKDRNGDGVYSVGDFDSPPVYQLSIVSSSEYAGNFVPEAYEYGEFREGSIYNNTVVGNFPVDKSVDEIASGIVFTPPSLAENDTVVWGIDYRDFPVKAFISSKEVPFAEKIRSGSLYNDLSPSDFSYGFDYKIGGGKADLSLTLDIPALSDLDPYNILEEQNYGLAMPRYDYFLSSFKINEKNPHGITVPSSGFLFESNNETVAEIDLINPIKENYSLYDYPNDGEITSFVSRGASINNLIMSSNRLQVAGLQEMDLLYAIEEVASSIPGFTIVDDLYHVHTTNYPVWAGKRLVHDPTDTIFFENVTLAFQDYGGQGVFGILGYDTALIFGSIILITLVITLKRKKIKKI